MSRKLKAFLICPVRNGTPKGLERLLPELDAQYDLHFPPRDTDQDDPIGDRICRDNRKAIEEADLILVWFDPTSKGILFDLGMAWAMRKPIWVLNGITSTPTKSFPNVLLSWQRGSVFSLDQLLVLLYIGISVVDTMEEGSLPIPGGIMEIVEQLRETLFSYKTIPTIGVEESSFAIACPFCDDRLPYREMWEAASIPDYLMQKAGFHLCPERGNAILQNYAPITALGKWAVETICSLGDSLDKINKTAVQSLLKDYGLLSLWWGEL